MERNLEDEFKNVPMFLSVLRGLPKLHDYRAVEYDLFTGEQMAAADEKDDMLAELMYRLELEKGLLEQIGRTDEAYRINSMEADIKRRYAHRVSPTCLICCSRFEQDPSTRGMLKVDQEDDVKRYWRKEIEAQKQEGERQIEKLKESHRQALLDRKQAIKKEKDWLDGEDWDAEVLAMRHKMQQSAHATHELVDGLLQNKLDAIMDHKKELFQMKEFHSLSQVERAGRVAATKEAQAVARRQVKGQFRVTDRSKDDDEIRQITAEHEVEHQEEQEQLEMLKRDQLRHERQLGQRMLKLKSDAVQLQKSQTQDLAKIQQHQQRQRGIGRRIDKMHLVNQQVKQQFAREDVVAHKKLEHKIHCLEHRMKRDLEKLDLKSEIFMALPSMNLDEEGNLIQAPPV